MKHTVALQIIDETGYNSFLKITIKRNNKKYNIQKFKNCKSEYNKNKNPDKIGMMF